MGQVSTSLGQRRSTRVEANIDIVLASVKTRGVPSEAPGVTLMVSKHGAKVQTTMHLEAGDYVRLTNPATNHSQLARVAWVGRRDSSLARLAFGIALEQPENFWGVYFPPEDWNEPTSWEDWEREEERVEPMPPALGADISGPTPSPWNPAPASVAAEVPMGEPIEVPADGAIVFVRGLSAARMPFQEQTVLHPLGGVEATIHLKPVVDIGRMLQVVFPPDHHVVRAHTTGIGRQPENGKWKMWVRLAAPLRVVRDPET